jgi:chemotaxis protein CheX
METLKTQCGIEAHGGKPFFKGKGEQSPCAIAAVLGINSPKFDGSLIVAFSEPVFLKLMEGMLGEKFTAITTEMEDGAAELLNIIYGRAKATLNDAGYKLEKAIPSVVRGKGLTTKTASQEPAVVLPFTTEVGDFYIEICVAPKSLS